MIFPVDLGDSPFSMPFMGFPMVFPQFSDKNHCFDHLYQMHPALLNFICISTRRRAWRAKPKKSNDVGISHKKKWKIVKLNIYIYICDQITMKIVGITSSFHLGYSKIPRNFEDIHTLNNPLCASGPSKFSARRGGKT